MRTHDGQSLLQRLFGEADAAGGRRSDFVVLFLVRVVLVEQLLVVVEIALADGSGRNGGDRGQVVDDVRGSLRRGRGALVRSLAQNKLRAKKVIIIVLLLYLQIAITDVGF